MFCTREPYLYTKLYKIDIEGQENETYQIFVFPQESMPSKKHKTIKMVHQSLQQKLILTHLIKNRNQWKMWLRKPTHLLYQKKRRLIQWTKQTNHKYPKKQSIPHKKIKLKHLTQ